jgi:hypothetical protein
MRLHCLRQVPPLRHDGDGIDRLEACPPNGKADGAGASFALPQRGTAKAKGRRGTDPRPTTLNSHARGEGRLQGNGRQLRLMKSA